MRKLTVEEAAQHYGVSTATIRRRVKAEELPHERESDQPNARLWIVVDDDEPEGTESETGGASASADAGSTHDVEAVYTLVGSLESQVTFLREELGVRNQTITELQESSRQLHTLLAQQGQTIQSLTQRIEQLPAPATSPSGKTEDDYRHLYLSQSVAPLLTVALFTVGPFVAIGTTLLLGWLSDPPEERSVPVTVLILVLLLLVLYLMTLGMRRVGHYRDQQIARGETTYERIATRTFFERIRDLPVLERMILWLSYLLCFVLMGIALWASFG